MDDREKLMWIDACQPRSPELSDGQLTDGRDNGEDPAMADLAQWIDEDPNSRALFDRVQRIDRGVRDAMQDVPVPAGLAGRLLARLGENPRVGENPVQAGSLSNVQPMEAPTSVLPFPSTAASPAAASPAAKSRGISRRKWAVGISAAACVAACVTVAVVLNQPQNVSLKDIEATAMSDYLRINAGRPTAASIQSSPVPTGYSPGVVNKGLVTGWMDARFLNRNGVAFFLQSGGKQAVLVAVPLAGNPSFPAALNGAPRNSLSVATGFVCTAWRSGDLLYVLVIEGEKSDLRYFVPPPRLT